MPSCQLRSFAIRLAEQVVDIALDDPLEGDEFAWGSALATARRAAIGQFDVAELRENAKRCDAVATRYELAAESVEPALIRDSLRLLAIASAWRCAQMTCSLLPRYLGPQAATYHRRAMALSASSGASSAGPGEAAAVGALIIATKLQRDAVRLARGGVA